MALPNPSINPPWLQSSSTARRSLHAHSPSRSPIRLQHFDPLLRDLSPTSTLRAFQSQPGSGDDSYLGRCVSNTSHAQRALACEAAQACLNVRSWARELESWKWSGSFDTRSQLNLGLSADSSSNEMWGSLPAQTVRLYEQRVNEIGSQLEEIDVEGLKDFVLSARNAVKSEPAEDGSNSQRHKAGSQPKTLDDFTTLVTATILQTLPYLSRLHQQLNTWSIRCAILTAVPSFTLQLARTQALVEDAREKVAFSASNASSKIDFDFSEEFMSNTKATLSSEMSSLGRQLDRFLDSLEGRVETVPDSWIDSVELLESQYAQWVVLAERELLRQEWQSNSKPELARQDSPVDPSKVEISETSALIVEPQVDVTLHATSLSRDFPTASRDEAQSSQGVGESAMPGVAMSIDPTLGADAQSAEWPLPNSATHSGLSLQIPSIDSLAELNSATTNTPDTATSATSQGDKPALSPRVKARAALFNDGEVFTLNKSKSPPVVRPFEHASNAFTRLFKKSPTPEPLSRSSSNASKRSTSSKSALVTSVAKLVTRSGNAATENGISNVPASAVSDTGNGELLSAQSSPAQIIAVPAFQGDIPTVAETILTHEGRTPGGPSSIGQAHSIRSSQPTSPWTSSAPETYVPTGMLSSPFQSPEKLDLPKSEPELPPDWPLTNGPTSKTTGPLSADVGHFKQRSASLTLPENIDLDPRSSDAAVDPTDSKQQHNSWNIGGGLAKGEMSAEGSTDAISERTLRSSFSRDFSKGHFPRPVSTVVEEPVNIPGETLQGPTTSSESAPSRHALPEAINARGRSISPHHSDVERFVPRSPSAPVSPGVDDALTDMSIRRASSTSIEAFSRSQVKSVRVRQPPSRRHSASSGLLLEGSAASSTNASPRSHSPLKLSNGHRASSPTNESSITALPTPSSPQARESMPTSPISPDDSPSVPRARNLSTSNADGSSELNNVMPKRRPRSAIPQFAQPPSSPTSVSATKQSGDNFDRHVSAILDSVHAPIRFKTRPGAETPLGHRPQEKSYTGIRPKTSRSSLKPASSMTLAPAEPTPRRARPGADEVKCYHLQTGKEEPIKLFVRLVGEDERVMVRVGGGWADLADYLKQYADHHGSRTVSESGFEVQPSPSANAGLALTINTGTGSSLPGSKRTVSMPAGSYRAKSPVPTTPQIPAEFNGDKHHLYESNQEWLSQPQPEFSMGEESPELDGADSQQLSMPANIDLRTPQSGISTTTSVRRNGAAKSLSAKPVLGALASETSTSRPSSRATPEVAGTVGLAGPASGRKGELEESKARWVEDMLVRAKASAEKRKDEEDKDRERYFGDMGRVGGTRRVIFRSRSGSGPGWN